ncbi:MAG: hypothetical protein LBT46_01120 [Planctomycetaceae bacterium]|jgi:hypothetical protein|nr:hypothetical protein [Planctomycetaceae bacterium]
MDKEKLQNLRKNVTELMVGGTLQPFEVDYLKKEYNVEEAFIFGQIEDLKMTDGADTADNTMTPWIPRPKSAGHAVKIAAGAVVAVIALYILYTVAVFFVSLPGKLIGGGAYQRGVGSYTVKYTARSYNGAKWKPVTMMKESKPSNFDTDTPQAEYKNKPIPVQFVTGWDKNNFCVWGEGNNNCGWFRGGKWYPLPDYQPDSVLFLNAQQIIMDSHYQGARIYDTAGYKELDVRSSGGFFHLTTDIVQCDNRNVGWTYTINIKTGKTEQRGLDGDLHSCCPFKEGKAIGCNNGRVIVGIVLNKKDVELYNSNHNATVRDMWAIDEKNFVLAGNGDITVYRDGQKTHPLIASSESFNKNDCRRCWGSSMDLFWIVDGQGSIVEFKNGQAGKQVVKSTHNSNNAGGDSIWVSPEGTVFGCFDGGLYKLE